MARERRDPVDCLAAAILLGRGLTQKQIGAQLAKGQPEISKCIKEAENRGFLRKKPALHLEKIPGDLLSRAYETIEVAELQSAVFQSLRALSDQSILTGVQIVRIPRGLDDHEEQLRHMAQFAASSIRDFLRAGIVIGVTFGMTLRYLTDRLEEVLKGDVRRPLTVFPLVGSFPYQEPPYRLARTSTAIARDLARIVSGKEDPLQLSLAALPAYVPREFQPHRDVFIAYCRSLPAFRKIFGDDPQTGLVRQADMILTAMGDMPTSSGGSPTLRARLDAESLDLNEMSRLAIGDVAGILLARPGHIPDNTKRLEEINDRFLGLRSEHLRECARRAASRPLDPGVVAIAHGEAKVGVVVEAVRADLVNRLVIDERLAIGVRDECRKEESRRPLQQDTKRRVVD